MQRSRCLQAQICQHRNPHPYDERVGLSCACALVGARHEHAHHRDEERESGGGVRELAIPKVYDDDGEEGLARLDHVREGDGKQSERHVGAERATQE